MKTMSQNNPPAPEPRDVRPPEQLITSSLASKLEAINKYEEILWKVRSGYLAILYAGLTFLVGNAGLDNLQKAAKDTTASLTIFFLILGFSLSAFSVDFAYLRKKMRVIVIRNSLVEAAYKPEYKFSADEIYRLLQVAAETPLKNKFPDLEEKYINKVSFNVRWVLLPIYAITPSLAFSMSLLYHWHYCGIRNLWGCN
jgi:hypothetical protein